MNAQSYIDKTKKHFKERGLKWPPNKIIEINLKIALKEIRKIKPNFNKSYKVWVFTEFTTLLIRFFLFIKAASPDNRILMAFAADTIAFI